MWYTNPVTLTILFCSSIFIFYIIYHSFNTSTPKEPSPIVENHTNPFLITFNKPIYQDRLDNISFTDVFNFIQDIQDNELRSVIISHNEHTILFDIFNKITSIHNSIEFSQWFNDITSFFDNNTYASDNGVLFITRLEGGVYYLYSIILINNSVLCDKQKYDISSLRKIIERTFVKFKMNNKYVYSLYSLITQLKDYNNNINHTQTSSMNDKTQLDIDMEQENTPSNSEYTSLEEEPLPTLNFENSNLIKKKKNKITGISEHYDFEKDGYKKHTEKGSFV